MSNAHNELVARIAREYTQPEGIAMAIIREESGTHLDPGMVESFDAMMRANRLIVPAEETGAPADSLKRPPERVASLPLHFHGDNA